MIRAQSLSKFFGYKPVLRQVSFELAAGQCLALLGANGAGKSTLLNILATISQPNTGQLFIGGHDVKRQAMQVRTLLGVVLHKPLVYDSLTANENLQFYARLYGGHCQPAQQLLAQVGLAQVANERVRTFSQGMRQRLALARALLPRPKLLLLDEPFSGLDAQGSQWLQDFLLTQKQAGVTTVFSSHALAPVQVLADGVLQLVRGTGTVQPVQP